MPKYTVCLQQCVEETTEIEVEADTPKLAIDKALEEADEADWEYSWGSTRDREAYQVRTKSGDDVTPGE